MAFGYRFGLLPMVLAKSPKGDLEVAGSLRPSDGQRQSFYIDAEC